MKVYFVKVCRAGDMRPLSGECEWYLQCLTTIGKYSTKRCPVSSSGMRQIFNPKTNNCTDSTKLAMAESCTSYKECLFIDSVSPFGKWSEMACQSGQHFDGDKQECIDAKDSTCGNVLELISFLVTYY